MSRDDQLELEREEMLRWSSMCQLNSCPKEPMSYIEVTRLPKSIDAKSLTSMIVTASRMMPKMVEICYKGLDGDKIGLVEYKTATDAYRAADKLQASSICRQWNVKLTARPEYMDREDRR